MTDINISSNPELEETTITHTTFSELGLPEYIIKAVNDIGFEHATPIQIQAIPQLLKGRDILGLAQTGSGKTAGFMLPLLANLDLDSHGVQILVLSPTRELAVQVAKATDDFVKYMPSIRSLAVYGGQPYGGQIKALKSGVQIVIATPGRLVDHINKGTINFSNLKAVVLDEADEMLSMGFADDLENILSQVPETAQTALFSATMPRTIENLTKKYLNNPEIIRIKSVKGNEPKIDQYFWLVNGYSKNAGLIRFLEVENYDAAIVFVKTRQGCNEVCEYLLKNNIAAASLHGDMSQEIRESTLNGLRNESINVLVATDVAARGLDIERIDLVVNFDLPSDNENYVHRVGRTGRAGREGRSISFVTERERGALFNIEKTIRKELQEIKVPNNEQLEQHRRATFKKSLEAKLNDHNLDKYTHLVEELIPTDYEPEQVLAALVNLATKNHRLVLPKEKAPRYELTYNRSFFENRRGNFGGGRDNNRGRGNDRGERFADANNDTYYLGVGREHNVDVKQIIGLINTYAPKTKIGQIRITGKFTTIELPKGFDSNAITNIGASQINGQTLNMRIFENRGGERRGGNGGGYNRGGSANYRGNRDNNSRGGEARGGYGERRGSYRGNRDNSRGYSERSERRSYRNDRNESRYN